MTLLEGVGAGTGLLLGHKLAELGHNIETKWLYDFLTLEKCRNFSQAAVSRNVSQPAFSRRIRALEQAIGVELLVFRMPGVADSTENWGEDGPWMRIFRNARKQLG